MAEEKTVEDFPLEKTRTTPKTGAEPGRNKRDRTDELPADTSPPPAAPQPVDPDTLKKVNSTANQTIDQGSEEVQGKLAVPTTKVMKRGQTLWTDEDGVVHKELNDAEVNAEIGKDQVPDYIQLHQEVLEGADPIAASLKYQGRDPEEAFREGTLENAELHPRTMGLGMAVAAENAQKERK
jgi:hypothetical protein